VATLIAWHGGRLVLLEKEFAGIAFSSVPAWVVQLVIPISFGLIGLLYLLAALASIRTLWARRQ
jgi:TRAP-type C4-dicarboxylate transport system permease small subunit